MLPYDNKGLNPLEIGSICNQSRKEEAIQFQVSIPLKSGLFVIIKEKDRYIVSNCLNPLEIGSICNARDWHEHMF